MGAKIFMQKCNKCNKLKPLEEFSFRNKNKNVRHRFCKACYAILHADYYIKNKARHLARVKINSDKLELENKLRIIEYLLQHPCVDCGEKDIIVLEFDHEIPKGKIQAVASMLHRGYSWIKIEEEIAKCSVRCANCHRRRTANQFSYYRVGHVA